MEYQDLLVGFIRLHILHHAAEGDLYGQWMIDELAHHGYKMSAGTLYPMLHGMERKGYLKSHTKQVGRTYRRFYRATALGRKALALVRTHMDELFSEIGEKPKKRLNSRIRPVNKMADGHARGSI
ncbi:MAG: PadR family transcriptional regulator [Bryobacteraceae bacterium]